MPRKTCISSHHASGNRTCTKSNDVAILTVLMEGAKITPPFNGDIELECAEIPSQLSQNIVLFVTLINVPDFVRKKTGVILSKAILRNRANILAKHCLSHSAAANRTAGLCQNAPSTSKKPSDADVICPLTVEPVFLSQPAQMTGVPEKSMSRRRLALNIPILQRHLSFASHRNSRLISSPDASPHDFFLSMAELPITPTGQILHTPSYPPALIRQDSRMSPFHKGNVRPWSSLFSSESPLEPTQLSPQQSHTPGSSSPSLQILTRRLSLAAPPEASPVHLPRRLSYSHTFSRNLSPIAQSPLAHCPIYDKSLASPLSIRTQHWIHHSPIHENLGGMYFVLPASPSLKV
ncbi:hypothetical protein Hypma_008783 [Hypsizygus marmoreus]|uniref:Uncharacterized protein n=1 Tax=Hypsizygus marmoreus TaxID=39966 RepID=A0A369JUB8_HYPMA|nr:hypothetical protein Hypma_008783 [Hypsizygus marmoreus]